jgi:hypothetical protein
VIVFARLDSESDHLTQIDWWTVAGTVASAAGVALGLYVLHVAKGARSAAEDARVLAGKRNLAEELEQASQYIQQVGDYLQKREWTAVRIRAQEIMTGCRQSLTRWPDGLSEARRDDVLSVSSLVHSIADEAGSPDVNDFKAVKLKRLSSTQLQAAALLSNALGEARDRAERNGG